ncbi:voltage-gated purine nucleotide uniporter SLC17A9 isoform X2 [Oryctolagus cuniculus]|uniref:voltage-gated purine nucleotide uniporter SLC17A9 isoform X2 n=1 Tax=Oryctolagus cuniculus TaxID=9986 RepID=UPI00387972B1
MLPQDEARRDMAEEARWSRPECQAWTGALLLGTCLLYCARASLSICAATMSQDFGWNKKEAGIVLSSFFWGYCFTQVAGGHLGDRCSSLCRLQHRRGEGHLAVGLRLGLPHGRHPAAQPSRQRPPGLHNLLARPHRPAARGLLPRPDQPVGPEGAGERAGLHLQHRGLRLPARDAGNWGRGLPAAGLVRLAECLLLLRRPHLALDCGALGAPPAARPSQVPWRQLFRKPSVWAAVLSQLSSACSFFILLSWLPTFFQETFPHSKGWVFNVVPWLVAAPTSLFSGFLADHLISQGYRTITVRKFMQVMGLGLSSIFALCVGHSSSFLKSVVFASASIGLQTFNHSGISVNIQDLAPSCAGFLFGVANTAGALAGPPEENVKKPTATLRCHSDPAHPSSGLEGGVFSGCVRSVTPALVPSASGSVVFPSHRPAAAC